MASHTDYEFNARIDRLANLLAYNQDVSKENPFEVAAARIYLKAQLEAEEECPPTQRINRHGP